MGLKLWGSLTSKLDGYPIIREVRCPQRTMESLFVNSALYSVR